MHAKEFISRRFFNLHNEVSNQANQWEKDVFKRRGQRQGLTTQCAQVSCLDGTDVALWWNGIICKCIALKRYHQFCYLWCGKIQAKAKSSMFFKIMPCVTNVLIISNFNHIPMSQCWEIQWCGHHSKTHKLSAQLLASSA